jgi:hypothetical protein
MARCDGWCTPLYIYLVLAVISLIATVRTHLQNPKMVSVESIIMSIIYMVFWTGVIYLLCSTCHENIAWIILLLPLIIMLLIIFLIFGAIGAFIEDSKKQN